MTEAALTRRSVLQATAAGAATSFLGGCASVARGDSSEPSTRVLVGDRDWAFVQLRLPGNGQSAGSLTNVTFSGSYATVNMRASNGNSRDLAFAYGYDKKGRVWFQPVAYDGRENPIRIPFVGRSIISSGYIANPSTPRQMEANDIIEGLHESMPEILGVVAARRQQIAANPIPEKAKIEGVICFPPYGALVEVALPGGLGRGILTVTPDQVYGRVGARYIDARGRFDSGATLTNTTGHTGDVTDIRVYDYAQYTSINSGRGECRTAPGVRECGVVSGDTRLWESVATWAAAAARPEGCFLPYGGINGTVPR